MKQRLVAGLFALAVFVSAFLLFQVQPLISKAILPWFGGTPNVWTTCLLFFQTVLFGGYLYAHLLNSHCSRTYQAIVHLALLLVAVLLIQIVPDAEWKPTGSESPVWLILRLLLVTVGLPYFVLSTTGPLLQSWFGNTFPGRSPYRLYALSNAGSLLALLSYPFLFEPLIGMNQQAALWTAGFVVLALLCGACAVVSSFAQFSTNEADPVADREEQNPPVAPQSGRWWQWFGLSMIASVMLLATTNQVCQDVAVVPFLWVVPLSLYLLTFILCFEGERSYSRKWYGLGGAFCVGLITYLMTFPSSMSFAIQIVIYFSGLFAVCMVCHGELARLKPEPKRLTAFYLTMSAGGASGGLFVGAIAPQIFPMYLEMHYGLIVCSVLTLLVYFHESKRSTETSNWPTWGYVGGVVIAVGIAITMQSQANATLQSAIEIERNFYGVLRTEHGVYGDNEPALTMWHGRILHGVQFRTEEKAATPTAYYGRGSGVGRTIDALHHDRGTLKVGIVGLGTGTLAAYGQQGDMFRCYEINETVIRLAEDQFTFLSDTPADHEHILGDARLMLENEDNQNYDVLVLDAFSGDSIPTHLLTTEAAKVYRRHLAEDGVLAIHISNLHFDLAPVAATVAEAAGLPFRIAFGKPKDDTAEVHNLWLIATHDDSVFENPSLSELFVEQPHNRVVWTDDFSNLFTVLHKTLF